MSSSITVKAKSIVSAVGAALGISPAHRLFLDESGDHTRCKHAEDPIGTRYLGLVGACMSRDADALFTRELEALKQRHFGCSPILHRVDIVRRRGVFGPLKDPTRATAFDDDLLGLLDRTEFCLFAVVIDKHTHMKKDYRDLKHPYHYCLHAMMERYCGWLRFAGTSGDVIAEQRGKIEDLELKKIFREIYERGTSQMSHELTLRRLSSAEIKLKEKSANVAGLQLADILAHPITRDVLVASKRLEACDAFGERIAEIARAKKYNRRRYLNQIDGYGRKLLY